MKNEFQQSLEKTLLFGNRMPPIKGYVTLYDKGALKTYPVYQEVTYYMDGFRIPSLTYPDQNIPKNMFPKI